MRKPADPFCSACGYSLKGLTESSKCPECGRPIVDVLMREDFPGTGKRYQSTRRLWGLPLVSIATGPHGAERMGRPVGIIAIGDLPRGVIAIGGQPIGVLSIGGVALGIVSFGGVSLGLLVALGGLAVGGIVACGGFAAGAYAMGGTVFALLHGVGGSVFYLR